LVLLPAHLELYTMNWAVNSDVNWEEQGQPEVSHQFLSRFGSFGFRLSTLSVAY
jgi:hypothetical protein